MLTLAVAQAKGQIHTGELLGVQLQPAVPFGERPIAMEGEIEIAGLGTTRDRRDKPAGLAAREVEAQRQVGQGKRRPQIEAGPRSVGAPCVELGCGRPPVGGGASAPVQSESRRLAEDGRAKLEAAHRQGFDAYPWQERW